MWWVTWICFSVFPLATFGNLYIRLSSAGKLLSPLHHFYHSDKRCGEWQEFVFLFFHLVLLWTCAFADAKPVSYFHYFIIFIILTKSVVSDMNFVFLSLHLLHTFVNLCTCLSSAGKLFSPLLSLWQKVWWVTWILFFSFSTCYFWELVHSLIFSW